jgi:C-terminal processing protease CtpA/Prc
MRCVLLFAVTVVLTVAPSVRAEDPPEGMIGIQLKIDEGKLVIVAAIEKSPAEKAGIKADDVLLKTNDYKVKEKAEDEDLAKAVKEVGKYKPGEKVKLTVKRGDKEKTIEVTVGKRSDIIKDGRGATATRRKPGRTARAFSFHQDHMLRL